ncbi:MAG TPA: prepilin peptidase [Terriglobales bacterium]|nr:prepilin peptidase [Terriglobales bacterium]
MNQPLSIDFYALLAFLFGLAFGSFLNVVIYRVPRDLSIVRPRSACPDCGVGIRAYDNIPVVSWVLLRGRCRNCGNAMTPRYAIVELLCGFLFVGAYYRVAPVDTPLQMWTLFKLCTFFFLLLGLIFIDFEHHLLPDALTYPGLAVGLLASVFVPLGGAPTALIRLMLSRHWPLMAISLADSVLGALVGSLFIWGVGEIYFRVRHVVGMGLGDVKLMAMIGAFLGFKLTLFTIFAGAIVGTIFGVGAMLMVWRKRLARRRRRGEPSVLGRSWRSARLMLRYYEVPFGVFLGSMAIVAAFVGNQIVNFYLRIFQ